MKNRIQQLNKGIIDVPKPILSFSEESLEGIVWPNRQITVNLAITSINRVPAHLYLTSLHPRVQVPKTLAVLSTGKLPISIDTKGLSFGDTLEGTIDIWYLGNSCSIPYSLTVGVTKSETSPVDFETLDDFYRYALENPEEAKELFSWKEFSSMTFMNDLMYQSVYRTFVSGLKYDSGLTEFFAALSLPFDYTVGRAEKEKRVPLKKFSEETMALRKEHKAMQLYLSLTRVLVNNGPLRAIEREADALYKKYPADVHVSLLTAYVKIVSGKETAARDILLPIQDTIQKDRLKKREEYVLFLYLVGKMQGAEDRIANAVRLCNRYWSDGPKTRWLAVLKMKTTRRFGDHPEEYKAFLKEIYLLGIQDAFVLQETVFLWNRHNLGPDLLTEYELRCILFGIRNRLFTEEKLLRILLRDYHLSKMVSLFTEVLKEAYRAYPNDEILLLLVRTMITLKNTAPGSFYWYQLAVERKITVKGLNEYFLFTAPRHIPVRFPESVVTYFAYREENESLPLDILYGNICTHYLDIPEIRQLYEDRIVRYGIRKAEEQVYYSSLIPVFDYLLQPKNVSENTAPVFRRLLSLHELEFDLPKDHRIIVHYPELDRDDSFMPEADGYAVIPLYSDRVVLAFEGPDPGRKVAGKLIKKPVFDKEDVRRLCSMIPDTSILVSLKDANQLLEKEKLTENEMYALSSLFKDRRLNEFYRARLYERMVDASLQPSLQQTDFSSLLLEGEFMTLKRPYRTKLLLSLLQKSHYHEAFLLVLTHGRSDLPAESLLRLVENSLNEPVLVDSPYLLWFAYTLYTENCISAPLMVVLAEKYRGTMDRMLAILRALQRKKLSSFNFTERLLTMALFTDDEKNVDYLFERYMESSSQDSNLVGAYLAYRAHTVLLAKKHFSERAMNEVKNRFRKLPKVCLLALAEAMSRRVSSLTPSDIEILSPLLQRLIEENAYLSCFSKFEKVMQLPFELQNRVYVEYRDWEDLKTKEAALSGRTLPSGRVFHRILREVYPGIFVQSFLLYPQEWMEYTLFLYDEHGNHTEKEGKVLAQENTVHHPGAYYEDLATLEKKLKAGDWKDTAAFLSAMIFRRKMVEEVFKREE